MPNAVWKPNSTVAAVMEHQGRFLLVEEETDDGLRFNQPAGHLDHGESLIAACIRETREETSLLVEVQSLVGIYQWSPPARPGLTYLRFAFAASVADPASALGGSIFNANMPERAPVNSIMRPLDNGIVRAVWMSYDEVFACRDRHRSPLVMQCIDDFRAGRRFPLDLIRHYD